jgi:chitinase
VGKANQTITFAALPDRTFGDADFAANATASSGLPVSFAASGNCTVSGAVVHLTSAGSCTITASQGGNANYFGAASVSRSFVIASSTSQPPPPTAVSKCVVPHLVGKTLANAKTAIARANCRVGHVGYAYSRARKKGVVLSQARRPGAVLPAKTTIALVVSRGPRP